MLFYSSCFIIMLLLLMLFTRLILNTKMHVSANLHIYLINNIIYQVFACAQFLSLYKWCHDDVISPYFQSFAVGSWECWPTLLPPPQSLNPRAASSSCVRWSLHGSVRCGGVCEECEGVWVYILLHTPYLLSNFSKGFSCLGPVITNHIGQH